MGKNNPAMTGAGDLYRCLGEVGRGQDPAPESAKRLREAIGYVRRVIPGQIKTLAKFIGSVDPAVGSLEDSDYFQVSLIIEDLAQCLSDAEEAAAMLDYWAGPVKIGEGGGPK